MSWRTSAARAVATTRSGDYTYESRRDFHRPPKQASRTAAIFAYFAGEAYLSASHGAGCTDGQVGELNGEATAVAGELRGTV